MLGKQQVSRSTLVVAPTIDLLHQWYARLMAAFQIEIGVYYGGKKNVKPLPVTTYHSAGDLMAEYGNKFKLLIFDEVHHLPAPSWGETALMSPAPLRLGLTATYPKAHEQSNGRWRVDELIGRIAYSVPIDDLAGEQLTEYRTERLRIDFSSDERQAYEANFAIYSTFFRSRQLQKKHGAGWLMELMRLSAFDQDARRAFLARQRIMRLLAGASGKLTALENLHVPATHIHASGKLRRRYATLTIRNRYPNATLLASTIKRTCPLTAAASNNVFAKGAYHARTCTAGLSKKRLNRLTRLSFWA